jgi:hypothetical protein
MVRRAWLVIAALAVVARVAHADAEIVELRYVAPPGCPARAVVEAAILERTPNVSLAASARRVFAITIEPIADGFRGTLVVDEVADKELSAQRCDDLATALALVTALAIDPTATLAPRPPAPSAWTFEADLGGMLEAGVSPGMMLAGVIEARATLRHRYQLELAAIAGRDSTTHDDAQARFTWLAARPAACAVWGDRGLTLGVCGHVELGAVQARGEMIVNQRDLTRLWLAAGAHAGAQYPLGARMFAHLQLGASLPLVRDRYLFAPNVSIHDTPGITGWLVVGVGMRFP